MSKSSKSIEKAYADTSNLYLDAIYSFLPNACQRDPHAVHQIRVNTRRMRSLAKAYKPALDISDNVENELGWLQRMLGHARDWDVFIQRTVQPLQQVSVANGVTVDLAKFANISQLKAYESAIGALTSVRFKELRDTLVAFTVNPHINEKWADRSVDELAEHCLKKTYKKIEALGARIKKLTDDELHDLRKLFKRYRYTVDIFADVLPKRRTKKALEQLTALQDTLGHMNDVHTGLALFRQPWPEEIDLSGDRLTKAELLVVGWTAALTTDCRGQLNKQWKSFNDLRPVWA